MRALAAGVFGLSFSMVVACGGPEEPVIQPEVAPVKLAKPERPMREHYLGMQVPEHEPVPFPNVRGPCEPGQTKSCESQMPRARGMDDDFVEVNPRKMTCMLMADGTTAFNRAACNTPLVVSFDDGAIAFTVPAAASASFLIGSSERTEWVTAATPWLALDRDGSGCIEGERELFRFDRLAELDENHDGRIDARDAAFGQLVLWADRDQDRRCTPGELMTLAAAGVVSLDVDYVTPPAAAMGSYEGERAAIAFRSPTGQLRRGRIVDVYLSPVP